MMDTQSLLIIGVLNLFVVSVLTMSGGIGLVMRPFMIFLGVTPAIVIGTSRVSAIPGSILSQIILHKSRKIDWRLVRLLVVAGVLGSLIGVYIITSLPEQALKRAIGVTLLIGAGAMLLSHDHGLRTTKPMLNKLHWLVSIPSILIAGVLLVLVGGMGSLTRLLYIFGYGKTHIEAAATQKAINFWQTTVTAIAFIALGLVHWYLLFVLAITSLVGNYIGTHIALARGESYLKVLVVLITTISAIKLLFFP